MLPQYRHGASLPKLDNLVPSGKMKILLVFLGLLGNSVAMPMQMPRMPGFSSKSEEMMRYGQFNFMNAPHMAQLGPLYGNGMPQLFPQYQMPMWPQPPPNTGHPQKPSSPSAPKRQKSKTDQAPETQKPSQPQPKKPPPKRPLKQPPPTPAQPEEETQPPQAFPPFGNGLFPPFSNGLYQQPPWQVPHRVPPGYGRPPVSNEEGGNPYFGYFGYQGFGGRPPYYSEEMFEQDFEKPKEEDPPKTESPGTEPSANSTGPETNSTQPSARSSGGSQGGNDTSPTGNSGPGTNTAQNGVISPPTTNVSGPGVPRTQITWGPSQPNIRENYPNPNIRNFPSGRQWRPTGTIMGHRQNGPFYRNQQVQRSPRWNSFALERKQAVRPGNPIYRRAYASTARGNSPNHAANLGNIQRKPQGPNKHPVGTNIPPLGPKHGTVVHNEKVQNPEKPVGPKERIVIPTRDPSGPWRNSQDYGVNEPNYKLPHPESNMLVPNFNSIDQHENSYYPRGDSSRAPNSDGQTQNQNLPKGIILGPRRNPYESETNRPELKHSTYQPAYPEEIPSPAREHFPAGRNTWNHQEISPSFKEDPGRQEEHLPHPSPGSRGGVYYPDYNSYDPRENSPYLRSNTWDERDDFPNNIGQSRNSLYPINTPELKETVAYNEEDPADPVGDEHFPGQSRWGTEETSFKEGPTDRHYEGEQYTSNQPKEYLPYSLDNPSKPREDFPYGEFYPWNPDENFPSYNTAPTVPPPVESRGYYVNNAVGQEESPLFPSWNSWEHKIQTQGQKERRPYFNRNFWDQPTTLHKMPPSPPHQKENQPYPSNSPAGLQKNPTWHEGENLNYGMQITRLNPPEREHVAFPNLIPPSYPAGQKEAHVFHLSQRGPCCAGGSTGHKDKPLALQDYTPSFGLAPGENQDTNPLYTEDSHTKHARHTISPTSSLPDQRNSSEKRLPGESQNPNSFRDDVSTLRRNTPCSMKNQLSQRGIMPFPEASSLQSKNTPCLTSDLGGDGNKVLEPIFEGNQFNERTVDLTPEQLVIGTPDEGPQPEGIRSEVQGNEGERQQQRPSSILHLPCFGSKIAKYHSSTGTPSSIGRQDPFDEEPIMPTESPNSLSRLATGAEFQSINVDPLNADEHTPFDPLQLGTNPQDHVQDCLLLQA
ncbi:enamelin [Enhydra lutris kenyoni]|uniref:Enamelin n=1 Tax=Enhydra lutris kenyoni TaxID=391180 RepID=A0A2Y9JN64_ENHLU|nr:enamelin [Enhydra lutris kenyoni]